jgi:predicted nucleic acid-binding protein
LIALDSNVLIRFLVRDDEDRRFVHALVEALPVKQSD